VVEIHGGSFPRTRVSDRTSRAVAVPILSLRPGDSPRLKGEDQAHVMRLAEIDEPLPPILVDRRTMSVIDGIHRLLAASIRGQETIDVEFFDGTPEDAFLRGVEANVRHGLPLSQVDRQSAAMRILVSHPDMSDRAVAKVTGLGARAVAELRRSSDAVPQLATRVGRDGRVRPLNSEEGRLRVAELMVENPRTSLRQAARAAGVSPATALDVRRRLERGEEPVPVRAASSEETRRARRVVSSLPQPQPGQTAPTDALEKLLRDPSLRQSEQGRRLLRLLNENLAGAADMSDVIASVPAHCLVLVMQIARQNSKMWLDFAQELELRARVTDPWLHRANGAT
jgi:ParB-like chromosome segregation protein Spo0J